VEPSFNDPAVGTSPTEAHPELIVLPRHYCRNCDRTLRVFQDVGRVLARDSNAVR